MTTKGYIDCIDPLKKVFQSRDVIFNEQKCGFKEPSQAQKEPQPLLYLEYSDANWAGDTNNRKSTSGYFFMMSGAAVSWKSQKQTCVALSTAEAEYIALAAATQEGLNH